MGQVLHGSAKTTHAVSWAITPLEAPTRPASPFSASVAPPLLPNKARWGYSGYRASQSWVN
jgi:hypothetical protein